MYTLFVVQVCALFFEHFVLAESLGFQPPLYEACKYMTVFSATPFSLECYHLWDNCTHREIGLNIVVSPASM